MKVKAAATLPGTRPSTLRGGASISWSGGAVNRLDASVRAVAIERFVPGAVSGRGVRFVEQVVPGKSDGFQLGVGFVEPESCHALLGSAVRRNQTLRARLEHGFHRRRIASVETDSGSSLPTIAAGWVARSAPSPISGRHVIARSADTYLKRSFPSEISNSFVTTTHPKRNKGHSACVCPRPVTRRAISQRPNDFGLR